MGNQLITQSCLSLLEIVKDRNNNMYSTEQIQELANIANESVARGGKVAMDYFLSTEPIAYTTKATGKGHTLDLVSEADKEVERVIFKHLSRSTLVVEDVVFIGEEAANPENKSLLTTGSGGGDPLYWYVDPIDGTANFAAGRDDWVVSVGAMNRCGEVIVSCVGQPVRNRMWWATRGKGALENNRKIPQRLPKFLNEALIEVGVGRNKIRDYWPELLGKFLETGQEIRREGSAGLALVKLATGEIDAYYGPSLQTWDWAGGRLIAEEAGICVVEKKYLEEKVLIAAVSSMFTQFCDVIEDSFSQD